MSEVSSLRRALVALLAISTLMFAAGVIVERSVADEPPETSGVAPDETHAEEPGDGEEGRPADVGEEEDAHGSGGEEVDATEAGEERERLLGVDLESTPLVVLAVLGGLALAALAASRLGRVTAFLLVVALVALLWAAFDVREVVHQIGEQRSGVALIAVVVAVLHLTAAALAGRLALARRGS